MSALAVRQLVRDRLDQRGQEQSGSSGDGGIVLIDEWFPAVGATLRPSTVRLYRTLTDAYIVPRIGRVPLQKLGPGHLNRLYAELRESGKRDGSPLGAETVRKVHRLMHRALRDALKWNRVARNAASIADPPRAARRRGAGAFLDARHGGPLSARHTGHESRRDGSCRGDAAHPLDVR